MAFRAVLTINSLDGHAILAVLALNGDAVLTIDADTGLAILAFDADAAGSTRLAIFAILTVHGKRFSRYILIHEDRDVAFFINLRGQVISCVFMAGLLIRALNLHCSTQLSCICTGVSSKLQTLACQICSCIFCNRLYITNIGGIRLAGISNVTFAIFFNTTAYMSNLVATTIDAIFSYGRAVRNRQSITIHYCRRCRCRFSFASFGCIGSAVHACQILRQLDFQLAVFRAVDTDVAICQVTFRTADDFQGIVQLLGNDSRIIALEFQSIFHGGYLMFTGLVRVNDTGQARSIDAFFTFDAILAICFRCSIIAILDCDINRRSRLSICTIHAIGASRSRETDMADTVFTGNGDRIFAVLAGDADFTVCTICSFRASDGDAVFTRCTIFTVKTADRDAIGAVQADMSVLAIDADLAVFTVFARFADVDVLGQLQIIGDLARCSICGFMKQDVLAGIDIFFCLFILGTGWRITFYSQCRMGACRRRANRLQSRIQGFQVLPS